MMFYGFACQKTRIPSIAIWATLFLLCFIVFGFAVYVAYFKLRTAKKWWNASVTTCGFCILSVTSCFVMILSNLSRALNFGDENLEGHFVTPIALSCFGSLTICALLNVCLLWIELSSETGAALTAQINLVKSKKIIGICFGLYLLIFSVLFFLTKSYTLGGIFSIVYMVGIVVVFMKGSFMLSQRLTDRNETAGISKVRRIIICARNVCVNCVGFCCSAGLYCIFSKYSSTGLIALCFSACVLLNGVMAHLWLLRYLIGISFPSHHIKIRRGRREGVAVIRNIRVKIHPREQSYKVERFLQPQHK